MVNKRWKFCCTWPYVTAHPYSLYFVDVELPIPFQAAVLFTQYVVGVIYIETYNTALLPSVEVNCRAQEMFDGAICVHLHISH